MNRLIRGSVLGGRWIIAIAMLGTPFNSRASHGGFYHTDAWLNDVAIALGGIAIVHETFALASGIVNGVNANRGKRPPAGWLGVGYATNSISIIGGILAVVSGSLNTNGGLAIGLGGAALALGGLGLGLTIWGHTKPNKVGPTLAVKPLVSVGARGELVAGAAIALVGY